MAYFTVDELRVASPCSVEWGAMEGDDHARFCGECEKHVYNLSMLTRAEGNELIREKEGNLCARYYRRLDGTVLTADCPVGLWMVRKQYVIARAKLVAAALAVWGVIAGSTASCSNPFGPPVVMGVLVDTAFHRDSINVPVHYPDTAR
jgi:hypothetical protein